MVMRKIKLFKMSLMAMVMFAVVLSGCKKTDPPTVNFVAEVNGFEVTFTVEATDVDMYEWNYGDGNTGVAEGTHTYTYATSGTYSVVLKVTGDGGDAEKTVSVTVLPSMMELLSGGDAMPNGKTWKMSTTATLLVDGASDITPPNFDAWVAAMGNLPFPDNVLAIVTMADEYDNLYTFKHDGTMTVDPVNDKVIAGYMYASIQVPQDIVLQTAFGLFQINYTAPTGMGYSIMKGDISMDIATEIPESDDVLSSVTITDVDYFEFTGGGFIGLVDYATKSVIRSIDENRMVVTVFIHGSQNSPTLPSLAITVSFDAI